MQIFLFFIAVAICCCHSALGLLPSQHATRSRFASPRAHKSHIRVFSSAGFDSTPSLLAKSAELLNIIPFCITPSSKSTTINDPTAGMNAAEIQDYMSNVGGGLCGASDFVKGAVGLSLNFSLLTFGVFTVAYGKKLIFIENILLN